MTAPVSIALDAQWFRAVLTIPAAAAGPEWLDELAAAFAEDPERIAEQLLALHELNGQIEHDLREGDDHSAAQAGAFADEVRSALAEDLPVDVTVQLTEEEARSLSEASLAAARHTFSARQGAGFDPDRKATPLRSVA